MVDAVVNGAADTGDWGDEVDDSYTGGVIPPRKTEKNADGTTTITDYSMTEDGYLYKTIKVVRYVEVKRKVSKSVAARKQWKKFGDCKNAGPGLERGISTLSIDEINMEWIAPDDGGEEEEEEIDFEQMAARDIQSRLKMERFKRRQEERRLGVANWAQMMSMQATASDPNATQAPGVAGADTGSAGPTKYQPPAKRGGSAALSAGESMYSRDDSATVRISNVSRNTSEADLEELCKMFGSIRRIFLSRDRETGESKGFAFVAYHNTSDAKKCIERLNGYGYDHLILQVEWSKPKEPRDGEGGSGGGGGAGGYSRFGR